MDDFLNMFVDLPVVIYDHKQYIYYYPEYKAYSTYRTDGRLLIVFEDTGHEYLIWYTPVKDNSSCILVRFGINWNIMVNNYNNDDYEAMNKNELAAISELFKIDEYIHVKSLFSVINDLDFNSTMVRLGCDTNKLLYYTGTYHSKKPGSGEDSLVYLTKVIDGSIN